LPAPRVDGAKIPPLAHNSPGENPLIYQVLPRALHMFNQPYLA